MKLVALALAVGLGAADVSAQGRGFARGGGGSSTSRFVSPAVVASWMSHESYADGSATTLLVLWRGTPGWFAKGGRGGASGGAGGWSGGTAGGGGPYNYQSFSEGGLTFKMEFDFDKKIVKILNQEISLKATNVVLVDHVDSTTGPAIVDYRWIDPGPPAPPIVPGGVADPIAGIISRSPELFEYLQCDLTLPDPVMRVFMPIVCGQMRGQKP